MTDPSYINKRTFNYPTATTSAFICLSYVKRLASPRADFNYSLPWRDSTILPHTAWEQLQCVLGVDVFMVGKSVK